MKQQPTSLTKQLFSQKKKTKKKYTTVTTVLEIEQWHEVPQRSTAKHLAAASVC